MRNSAGLAQPRRRSYARLASAALAAGAVLSAPALAQGPVPEGTEFRVNTATAENQAEAAVAVDADGDIVVVWTSGNSIGSPPPPGSGPGPNVLAQRYSAAGAPQGAEFAVSRNGGNRFSPSVAMNAGGDFIVAWNGTGFEGDIFIQRFTSDGLRSGLERRVNATTGGPQSLPAVAMNADGDLVVVWQGTGTSDYGTTLAAGIFAQCYTASGAIRGNEWETPVSLTPGANKPAVAMDAAGDFVVVWEDGPGPQNGDGSQQGVSARRFAADGAALGAEFRVNTYTADYQGDPAVAMRADGSFVVVWRSQDQDGQGFGIYGQQYSAAGSRDGGEFRVNTTTAGSQIAPTVGMDAGGRFVVAWHTEPFPGNPDPDGSSAGVFAQAFSAGGVPVGPEFQVNTTTQNAQRDPVVGVGPASDAVVVWTSQGQDGSGLGLYAQRYSLAPVSAEPSAPAALALTLVPNPAGARGGSARFSLAAGGPVRVSVVDALGREVAVLLDGLRPAGACEVSLDTARLPAGVYVVRLVAGGSVAGTRLVVAR